MKRVISIVTSDLATDQRVLKTAGFLSDNNYSVLLVGRLLKKSFNLKVPFETKRIRFLFNASFLFYAEYNIRIFIFLLLKKCTHILSNDTDTLPAAYFAARLKGVQLVFDAHELFPEVPELLHRKFVKKIWTRIEDVFLPKILNSITVCDSIADYYNSRYGIKMNVIRNIPVLRHSTEKILNYGNNKIILYQGALNTGRGLEWVIEAMQYVNNAVLVIIGTGDIEFELRKLTDNFKLNDKVQFLGQIAASELYRYTPSADIGLCLLENAGLSYQFSLPNRIFDYLHADVPVLATRFCEIEKVVDGYKTGVLIDGNDIQLIASTLQNMLDNPFDTSGFQKIAAELCWENEAKKLLNIFN